jgi:carbonic anhydrase
VAIQENVIVQLQNLQTLPSVAARLASGNLNLHGWVYKLETGDVFAYDGESGQFGRVADRRVALRGVRRTFT